MPKYNGKVVQHHHVFYEHKKPDKKRASQREIVVPMYMHEHLIVSKIQRLNPNNCSKGFWQSLKVLVEAYGPFAHEIPEDVK